MSRHKTIYLKNLVFFLLIIFSLSTLSGCSYLSAKFRGLLPSESEKLMAAQSAQKRLQQEEQEEVELSVNTLEQHGDQLALKKDYPAAIFQYQNAINLAEGDDRLRLISKTANLFLKNKQWQLAAGLYKKLLKSNKSNAENWQGLGLALLADGDLDASWEALIHAINLEPERWKAHNGLGLIYNYRGVPNQAVASFKRAIQYRPLNSSLYNNLGMALMLDGNLEDSELAFRKALLLKPDNKRASNNLGILLARQNRDLDALKAFAQSVGTARAHNNLGVIKAWGGDKDGAIQQFIRAKAAMPLFYDLADQHIKSLEGLE